MFKTRAEIAEKKENIRTWQNNLVHFEKSKSKRGYLAKFDEPLDILNRLPKMSTIIGRFQHLASQEKSVDSRCKSISVELSSLWLKLNIPTVNTISIKRKVRKLISKYQQEQKSKKKNGIWNALFDITNEKGIWLSEEDKKFYKLQIETNGEVGFVTGKKVNVHPSKNICRNNLDFGMSSETDEKVDETVETDDENVKLNENTNSDDPDYVPLQTALRPKKRRHSSTALAVNLVKKVHLSTHQSKNACLQLSNDGIEVPTPSQSGIYKGMVKEADGMKEKIKSVIQEEVWALHFDGKKIEGREIRVVMLKNKEKEVNLGMLSLCNGKARTIYNGICEILNDYDIWNAVKGTYP